MDLSSFYLAKDGEDEKNHTFTAFASAADRISGNCRRFGRCHERLCAESKIGVVSDYYNLIRRHNINNYFLCKIVSFGDKHLTRDEIEDYHLSTLKLKYEEALAEYEKRRCTKLGRLVASREMPVLKRAKELLDEANR